ncbi:hypothetical protein Dform_01182 [Dehalogenimonas formicexedens]|uniref:Uncharacterized protein n=1 Tax=Dehalogenimonas formicexedens TaxID=1839801 RepID=A0A1P8F7R4_9CHLR|nr:hypothetical protein [Dehalogenimonas formicexedens]APV44514.1 hypothetical protein Dform_01182 [Dehalogenimonas formicexedens]
MEQDQNSPAAEPLATEEARLQLIRLTSEYYSLRAQCNSLAPDQNSQGDARDARSVLIIDRLEEITQETKQLLPSIYPQLDIKIKPTTRQRRSRQTAEK